MGDARDLHVQAVARRLADRPLIIDAASQKDALVSSSTGTHTVKRGSQITEVGPNRKVVGWVRRIVPDDWMRGTTIDSLEATELSSWATLLGSLLQSPGVRWLSRAGAITKAENKASQLGVAHALGIETPKTVITNDLDELFLQFSDRVVAKPLGRGSFLEDGQGRVVFATPVDLVELPRKVVSRAPFIFQELLEAVAHWRIVTVRDQVWAARLDARGVPVDWRRDAAAHRSFVASLPPVGTSESALRMAEKFDLGYSSQDWIETKDGLYFIELNPSGQWLFLPETVSVAITASIAAWLGRGNSID